MNIPPGTLRSIELGLRKFSPEIQARMCQNGLEWDAKDGRWLFTYDHEAELSLHLLETFRRLSRGNDFSQDHDAHAACEKIISLLREVAPADYTNFLLDLNASLNRLRETYKIEGSKKTFERRSLRYWVRPTASGGQQLIKGFASNNFPDEKLLDFSEERKWRAALDDDEHSERPGAVNQPAA